MTIRVVHCGTGNVGIEALRGILHHPDLELVGHYVHSPEKLGQDSGVLVGEPPSGIIATNDWGPLIALKADCLCYCGNSIGRERDAITDIGRFLERGTNVVTISNFPLAFPPATPSDYREYIDTACRKGGASVLFTGIDPGWATTDLAVAALACADRIDCVRVMELGWWGDYTAEYLCREYFGFGKEPGFQPLLVTGGFIKEMWAPTLLHIASRLGIEIDDWSVFYEADGLDHDIETGFGVVRAGTASAVHFELRALSRGRPIAIVEHVDLVGRGAGRQWAAPFGPKELAYRIQVEGDPSYSLELNFDYPASGKLSAMPAVNSIPSVCAARPGLLSVFDIPRYVTRNLGMP
jgi:hypothetical protein